MSNKEHEAQNGIKLSIEQPNNQATSDSKVHKDSADTLQGTLDKERTLDKADKAESSEHVEVSASCESENLSKNNDGQSTEQLSIQDGEQAVSAQEQGTGMEQISDKELSSDKEQEIHATQSSESSQSSQEPIDPSMDNEISRVTGRPQMTKEDNEKMRSGPRFFHKAMESRARALGEDYSPYRIPPEMRAALAKIDHEAALEKAREKAAAQGKDVSKLKDSDLELESSAIEQLHAVEPEEQERLRQESEEKQKIELGGARFYGNYQKMIARHSGSSGEHELSSKAKIMRNLKLALIVIVALAGYIGYNEFFVDQDARSISELKSMLPYPVDEHTTMVRIDDRNDEFKIFFERTPEAYEGMSETQKEESLDLMEQNAPMLCNNALLHSIITSGKKVTVLLEATDGSFHREFTVASCPVK